jgi:hypothetical protein
MTNCINITGAGLEPLRGSAIIEQIDLSLVGEQQSPWLRPEPPISCDHVLPILDSIIEREGCSLKHLQFPKKWRKDQEEPSTDSEFHALLLRYNQMWTSRGAISCLECNQNLPPHRDIWIETRICRFYGIQLHTCCCCLAHYCYKCETEERERRMLYSCVKCERDYCTDCSKTHLCRSCEEYYCIDCYEDECQKCNEKICVLCFEESKCEGCDKLFCAECNDIEGEKVVRTCDECDGTFCDDCQLRRLQQGQQGCAECIKQIAPLLAGENKRLYKEVEQLKLENKELKVENKELKQRAKA